MRAEQPLLDVTPLPRREAEAAGGLDPRSATVYAPLAAAQDLWHAVDRLVDRAPTLADLRVHRLQLLAAHRWQVTGRPIPDGLGEEQRAMLISTLAVPYVLRRAAEALDEPMLLIKGPELAAFYPRPELRVYHDLDLIVADAGAAQRALIAAGFQEVGDPSIFVDIHHERPLWLPGTPPVVVELHSEPKWVEGLEAPAFGELLADAVPSSIGVPGVFTPFPVHHAVLLAAHSWAHVPLGRLSDLVDVAAVCDHGSRSDAALVARRWGVRRLWRTTIAAVDHTLFDRGRSSAQVVWAWNLRDARERTVLGTHLERLLSPFWGLPPFKALAAFGHALAAEIEPAADETWRDKLNRIRKAIRNAFVQRSEHVRQLGPAGDRRRRR